VTRKKARTAIDGAAGATRGRPAFVRAPLRVVLAVVLGAAAAVRAADRIEDAELAGAMRELDYSLREQKTLERPLHDVVSRYREQLQRARTAREAAIAHFLLAAALERAGSRDASVGQLQLAVGEFDAFPLAHMTLGKLYMDEGNLDRARDCFARCREVDPERVEATVALAVTGLREGTAEGAEEARALLEPLYVRRDVPDVASWLAMAHLRRAQASPDPVEARAALERAWTLAVEGLREAPERDNARAAFATALRALDDDPDRVPRFATVMRSLPPGPAPYLTVASVAAVFRSTGRAARAGFWLNVALSSHAALREPDALESSLAAAVGDEGLRAVAIDAARACRERFLDAHRPIALRRGDAHLLGAVYLP
jgi:tetratricopeptide (TPR) repeat protein